MRDANPICTLGDYSRPSHEGYMNTIELLEGNNVVPLQSDTIWIHLYMGGSYYSFPCSILSTRKDRKTPQRYPDVPTTSRRISLGSMDSFQGRIPKSPSSWHRPLAPIIMEYLVNISKRGAFWSLNKDILKIAILTTNTPYPSRKIRHIRARTHQRPQRKPIQYVVSSEDQYALLEI
ncbi:hypothetical protein Tco_0428063 [Tanacetum coccineum]